MWIIATHCDLHFIGLGANMQADYGKNFLAQNGKQSDWLDAVRARKRAPNRSLSGVRSAAYAALAARPMLLAAHTRSRVATGKSVSVLPQNMAHRNMWPACCLDADAGGDHDRRHDDGESFPTPIYL